MFISLPLVSVNQLKIPEGKQIKMSFKVKHTLHTYTQLFDMS